MSTSMKVAALALFLAAGSVSAVETSNLSTARSGGTSTLTLAGTMVRSSANTIINQKLIAVPKSSKIIATWDEVLPGGALEHYYGLSLDGRTFAQVQPTTYDIRLTYASFDPKGGEPLIPAELRAGEDCRVYLVQFVLPPIDEFRRDLTALGGTVEAFLTDHTHIVTMDAAAAAKVAALPYVRWVGKYHPAYRLERGAREELLTGKRSAPAKRYSIQVHRRGMAQQTAIGDAIAKSGGILEVFTPDQFRMEATLTRAQLLKLASMNEVCYIDRWLGPGGTDMQVIRQLQGAIPTLSNLSITGQGVRGEVHDTEVLTSHVAYQTPPVLLHGGSAGSPGEAHGSACYGIIFANWPANPTYNGMDTNAEQGIFIYYGLSTQFNGATSRLTLNTQATDPAGPYRSCFQTSSVGSPQITAYSTISAETDDYLFQVDYLSFQSQSNTGTMDSRPQAWAKNIVSVGGIGWQSTLTRADDNYPGSSFGPAADGRLKPDLANCYDQIPSSWGSSTTGTTIFGGISGATPITAGDGDLLLQMWHQSVFPGFGGGSSVFADRPRSTTAKALMVNTAYRYPLTQGDLTRFKQGWGMPDLTNLYNLRNKLYIINETDLLQNAQTKFYPFTVTAGEPSIGFTMAYIDPAGVPAAAQARINDLSIRVTDPNGNTYWGNNGLTSSNWSSAGGSANTVDTVENVFIQNPVAGPWTLEVIGSSIVADAHPQTAGITDAAYGLVVSGAAAAPATPLYFQFVGNPPSLIAPGIPTDVNIRIIPGAQTVAAGTPTMFYRTAGAGAFTSVPLTSLGGNDYKGTLPALSCGNTPQYYFTTQTSGASTVSFPSSAPASFFSSSVGTISTSTLLQVDFDTTLPPGWAASGLWHITGSCAPSGTPCAGVQAAYYGQDASCNFDTGAANTGSLTSPAIIVPPVPAGGSVTLSFCSALQTEANTTYDIPEILVNGVRVGVAAESAAWTSQSINLSAYAGQVITLTFKFTATDGINNTGRGWHVDNVKIVASTTGCTASACYANCDGSTANPILNANDFQCFLNQYAANDSRANCDNSTANPILNANDFQCFLNKFAAGCS